MHFFFNKFFIFFMNTLEKKNKIDAQIMYTRDKQLNAN